MSDIVNHQEAYQLAYIQRDTSNLARCFLEQYQELLDAKGSLVAHGHNNDYCIAKIKQLEAENAALRAQIEAASKQEPILWIDMLDVARLKSMDIPVRCMHQKYDNNYSPLYAHPPIPKEKT